MYVIWYFFFIDANQTAGSPSKRRQIRIQSILMAGRIIPCEEVLVTNTSRSKSFVELMVTKIIDDILNGRSTRRCCTHEFRTIRWKPNVQCKSVCSPNKSLSNRVSQFCVSSSVFTANILRVAATKRDFFGNNERVCFFIFSKKRPTTAVTLLLDIGTRSTRQIYRWKRIKTRTTNAVHWRRRRTCAT